MELPETQDSPVHPDKQADPESGAATDAPGTPERRVLMVELHLPAEMEMTDDQVPWVLRVTPAHEATVANPAETASPADPVAWESLAKVELMDATADLAAPATKVTQVTLEHQDRVERQESPAEASLEAEEKPDDREIQNPSRDVLEIGEKTEGLAAAASPDVTVAPELTETTVYPDIPEMTAGEEPRETEAHPDQEEHLD